MSMVINHNLPAMNTLGKLTKNSNAMSKSMEKLSSGLRINRAGDDAAGLAISEKMRGQIRGLDVANANAQDATNMLNTAEGALGTTEDILQRMKELATQAANDTYVKSDRGEIQKEINQLTSEINRIGNTTEFNTQKLLKGDGSASIDGINIKNFGNLTGGVDEVLRQGTNTIQLGSVAQAGDTVKLNIGGQAMTITFVTNTSGAPEDKAATVSADGLNATVYVSQYAASAPGDAIKDNAASVRDALTQMIENNSTLNGNVEVIGTGAEFGVKAVKGSTYDGKNASVNGLTTASTFIVSGNMKLHTASTAVTGTTMIDGVKASVVVTFSSNVATGASALAEFGGKGMTIGGVAIEFYDGSKGAYTGDVKGVDISRADDLDAVLDEIVRQVQVDGMVLTHAAGEDTIHFTADTAGTKAHEMKVSNGVIQENFKATFQVGANKGQSMTIEIADARASALGISGAAGKATGDGSVFASGLNVTDGTSTTLKEAALDVSNHANATAAIETIGKAIEKVSAERSKMGAYTNRLEYTIDQVSNTSENISNSESRIRDVDMASEMMKYQTKSVNSQAAQAMLAQANQSPQNVLSLLR